MKTKSLDQRVAEHLGMEVCAVDGGVATHFYDASGNYAKLAGYWTDDLQRAADLWDAIQVTSVNAQGVTFSLLLDGKWVTMAPDQRWGHFEFSILASLLVWNWLDAMDAKVQS